MRDKVGGILSSVANKTEYETYASATKNVFTVWLRSGPDSGGTRGKTTLKTKPDLFTEIAQIETKIEDHVSKQ